MNPELSNSVSPKVAVCQHFKFEGKKYRLYKREPGTDAPWYFSLQRNGQRYYRCLDTNLAENAIPKAKAMITAAKGAAWEEFLGKTALRQTIHCTRPQLYKHYREYPNLRPSKTTRELNIHALEEICGPGIALPNGDTVWNWKQKILEKASAESALQGGSAPARHRQLLRSANSRLIQARSIFTNDLLSYYKRQAKLELPKTIEAFLKEPKFPSDETGKTDYWPPSDPTIAATFKSLEQLAPPVAVRQHPDGGASVPTSHPGLSQPPLRHSQNGGEDRGEVALISPSSPSPQGGRAPAPDRNLYLAVWLALGFGLRKSEITAAKKNWFQEINGILYCAGDELAKNNRFPRVRCQLGAWDKIAPHIADLADDAPVLTGTETERNDDVFRRISHWLKGLGWKTQKAIHEFRSYAGCQIAMGDRTGPVDLRSAQEFLRHANITTTENFYLRYLRSQVKEVALQLPVAPVRPAFVPMIVNGGK